MKTKIAPGEWPTMINQYTENNKIDYNHVEKLVEWYIERGVAGIFAVCQSSEMFYLDESEKIELAKFIVKTVAGRVGVVASGHTADRLDDQIRQIDAMAQTGADTVVLLPNRFAAKENSDDFLIKNLEYVISRVDMSITFGFYECPHPYKRVLTPEVVSFLADTGRFGFMKDTCCDSAKVAEKIKAGRGVIQVFNANCAQLLETLKAGASGFSGVMANFHPELYSWLCANYEKSPALAERVQNFLGVVSACESRMYPINAKKYLKKFFFPEMSDFGRSADRKSFTPSFETELLQLSALYAELLASWGIDLGVKI